MRVRRLNGGQKVREVSAWVDFCPTTNLSDCGDNAVNLPENLLQFSSALISRPRSEGSSSEHPEGIKTHRPTSRGLHTREIIRDTLK